MSTELMNNIAGPAGLVGTLCLILSWLAFQIARALAVIIDDAEHRNWKIKARIED